MNSTPRRWARRACAALGAIAIGAGALVFSGAAAYAASGPSRDPSTTAGTLNCYSSQDRDNSGGACDDITPTLACVWDNGDGTFSAALGFDNKSGYTLILPAGTYQNAIYGNGKGGSDVGQTSSFRPGVSTTEFVVTWDPVRGGDQPKWELGGSGATTLNFSSTSTPACASHPVPIMGNAIVWGISGGAALCALVLWNRRSMRRKEWIRRLSQAA